MSYKQIIGTKRWRSYSSDKYDRACIEVEVLDHVNCPDSWKYEEREYESLIEDITRTWIEYYGKDLLHCTVRLKTKGGTEKEKHVSLVRSLRSDPADGSPVYRTSAMVKNSDAVRYRQGAESFVPDYHSTDHDMIWELAGPDPISNEEQVSQLLEEAHRLFEPRIPVSI